MTSPLFVAESPHSRCSVNDDTRHQGSNHSFHHQVPEFGSPSTCSVDQQTSVATHLIVRDVPKSTREISLVSAGVANSRLCLLFNIRFKGSSRPANVSVYDAVDLENCHLGTVITTREDRRACIRSVRSSASERVKARGQYCVATWRSQNLYHFTTTHLCHVQTIS